MGLSSKSKAILTAIAEGRTIDEVLAAAPHHTYQDVVQAAREAIATADEPAPRPDYHKRMEDIRRRHPRAYLEWCEEEDLHLRHLHEEGKTTRQIAEALQRQSGAVRSRLIKLGIAP